MAPDPTSVTAVPSADPLPDTATAGETSAGRWIAEVRRILDAIESEQMDAISETARLCADAISNDGMVHLFGTGHSRIPLEEMFPRYGSYPGFHPMAELSMTFHTQVAGSNGQRQAMFIERMEGLAETILENFAFGRHDMMIVFSASGRTSVPIEMAMGAAKRGMPVVAVTSVSSSMSSPSGHPSGTRLLEHADIVIDICTPTADALVTLEGLDTPVGPGSTVSNAAIVNEIKVQTAEILIARGAMPPVITSSSVVGAERAEALFDAAYREHARRYSTVLAGARGPTGTTGLAG